MPSHKFPCLGCASSTLTEYKSNWIVRVADCPWLSSLCKDKVHNISEPLKKSIKVGIRSIQTFCSLTSSGFPFSVGDSPVANLASTAQADSFTQTCIYGAALHPVPGLQIRGGQPSAAYGLLYSTACRGFSWDMEKWNVWCLTKLSLGMDQVLGITCVGLEL